MKHSIEVVQKEADFRLVQIQRQTGQALLESIGILLAPSEEFVERASNAYHMIMMAILRVMRINYRQNLIRILCLNEKQHSYKLGTSV